MRPPPTALEQKKLRRNGIKVLKTGINGNQRMPIFLTGLGFLDATLLAFIIYSRTVNCASSFYGMFKKHTARSFCCSDVVRFGDINLGIMIKFKPMPLQIF